MDQRESFNSRIGFLLVSAGCAIGIGNVWRFPYVTGENGGGLFVLIYLFFLVVMGLPVLTMELAVGRAGRSGPVGAFRALQPKGSFWHVHGLLCLAGNYLLMMFYTTVSGWMVSYFFKFLSGTFDGMTAAEVPQVFDKLLANPAEMTFWMGITVLVGAMVVSGGLEKGLERVTKVMMSALLLLILVLSVHSFTLPGAAEGLSFFLLPDVGRAMEIGLGHVIVNAMNQAFFTLSLGIGSMEIFGSYMSSDHTLTGESARICVLDTIVAICSGLIIFPACFSYGIQPNAGPALIFVTLPNVFVNMGGGRLWGSLFFLFMTFASFSTVNAVMENLVAGLVDNLHISRRRASVIVGVSLFFLSLPCLLGYNLLSGFHPLPGKDILDTEDFIVSNLLLPGGSLVFLLFCVTRLGWNYKNYIKECNSGSGMKLPDTAFFKGYLRFVLPILIIIILVSGLL